MTTALPPDMAGLRPLLDHIPGRVIVLGPDRRYLYVNREFLEFFRLREEEAVGHHMAGVMGEEIHRTFEPVAEKLFHGEPQRWELSLIHI